VKEHCYRLNLKKQLNKVYHTSDQVSSFEQQDNFNYPNEERPGPPSLVEENCILGGHDCHHQTSFCPTDDQKCSKPKVHVIDKRERTMGTTSDCVPL
jgi:hypothetical protein